MLLKEPNELRAVYPSSRFQTIEPLQSLFQTVERGVLQRILGSKLYAQILEDYNQACVKNDGIWADRIDEPTDKIHILRACQSVIVYHALRDNVGILSSSLNQGGGFNQATAQNYDTLDKDNREELKKDLYHNSLRAVENLLTLLEEDAKGEQIYTSLWKESTYYYYQSQLLIPSASVMHPYFLDLGANPHSKFVSILSNIFDAQTLRIESRIGCTLMSALLEVLRQEAVPQEDATVPDASVPEAVTVPEVSPSGIEVSPSGIDTSEYEDTTSINGSEEDDAFQLTSPDKEARKKVLLTTLPIFRHALASFVRADMSDNPTVADTYNNRGERYLITAVAYFVSRPDLFHDELASDLDTDYRSKHNGRGIDDEDKKPSCRNHEHGMLDIGGLCHK